MFALSGCGNSDQYAIERDFWKVNKQAQAILKNPLATPLNEVERVVSSLQKFSDEHRENILAVRADLLIGKIYLAKGMYEQARAQFENVSKKYSKSAAIVSESMFLTGHTYQLQNNPDKAVAHYKNIINKYPLSPRGLQAPLYIAKYYESIHEPVKMQEAYKDAISHYELLAQKDPKSLLGLRAYMLMAECYGGLTDWNNSILALESIITNFKERAAMDGVLFNIAFIYRKELHDTTRFKETLQRLIMIILKAGMQR